MKLLFKSISLLFLLAGVIMLCACSKESVSETESTSNETKVQALPKLLDLGAHKCIPCKKMAPILDELAIEYKGVFDVEFIDVWQAENKERAKKYMIESIPTQIFFDASGKELWRHVGFISKEDILSKWKELGYELEKPVAQESMKVTQSVCCPKSACSRTCGK
ncbi:MAG: thioredoxin family protein [Kiritimatiellae bacterium]|jgi:thioredoxin 1|nr:thioredoxin family protein [Kiritimatiellia bacterium]